MISAHTTYQVAAGMEQIFEATISELQQKVIGGEPGTVAFQLYRAAEGGRLYKVVAHFRDEAAVQTHNAGAFLQAVSKRLYAACEQPPQVEIFKAL